MLRGGLDGCFMSEGRRLVSISLCVGTAHYFLVIDDETPSISLSLSLSLFLSPLLCARENRESFFSFQQPSIKPFHRRACALKQHDIAQIP